MEIRRAVEELFEVDVKKVRTMQQPGKKKRVGRFIGRKPSWKKAIVELAEGQSIEFFEGV
jgi:large subunit ribosomal protein L23